MKEANKLKVKYSIIVGENELKKNKVFIKDMKSGDQKEIDHEKIIAFFK